MQTPFNICLLQQSLKGICVCLIFILSAAGSVFEPQRHEELAATQRHAVILEVGSLIKRYFVILAVEQVAEVGTHRPARMEVVAQSGIQKTVYRVMTVGNLEDRLREVGIQAQFADGVKVHRQGVVGILQQVVGRRKGIGLLPAEIAGQREFGLKPRESAPLGGKRSVQGMVAQVIGPFVLCHIFLVVGIIGLSVQTEVRLAEVLAARQGHTPGGFRAVVPHGGYQGIVGQVEAFKIMVGGAARPTCIQIPGKERYGVQIRQAEVGQRGALHRKAVFADRKGAVIIHHRAVEPRVGVRGILIVSYRGIQTQQVAEALADIERGFERVQPVR